MNIVFDLAGVVVRYVGHADWLALDRGTLSQQDAIVRAAHRTGLSASTIAHFFAQMSAAWVPIAGTVDLLERLHTQGQPLFCLSNMHVASIAYLEQTYAFWGVFTGVVISCLVQLIKPEPAIYAYLLQQYGLEAS